ncbi:dienelactone hydrolase family protein [Cellulosimicrobium cellulans]|uniref:dienelactone hydrolase family protein n=1 Tax=Cellulosimicrobium cellulans TaxID=1710 RepID=UPI0036E708DD
MNDLVSRDVEYTHDGTRMIGLLVAPSGARSAPTVLLVHDAFGLSGDMVAVAHGLAELGFAVFAADVWGERTQPATEPEIGPLIGSMVGDRARWIARVAAAHDAARDQPEVDGAAVVGLGYCFGGSSVLEYVRAAGDLRGAVSVHGGLDLLAPDWSTPVATGHVLVCTGSADPMATAEQRAALTAALTAAGVSWELDLYGGAKHAFTSPRAQHSPNPEVVAYDARAAARAWDATVRFLHELFPAVRLAAGSAA